MTFLSLKGFFKEKFFENHINYQDVFLLTRYYYPTVNPKIGFIKKEAYTANIDISVDEEVFFSKFKKNTRYEINRAKREGVVFEIVEDINLFFHYYNDFAKAKGLEELNYNTLLKYKEHMVITQARKDDLVLSMHVHLYNEEIGILLYSASQFRNIEDNKVRNLIGYANRFLHFEEMKYFKSLGCSQYDFGGYAYGTTNEVEQRINHFKDSFLCVPQKKLIYSSWMLVLFTFLKSLFNKMGIRTKKL